MQSIADDIMDWVVAPMKETVVDHAATFPPQVMEFGWTWRESGLAKKDGWRIATTMITDDEGVLDGVKHAIRTAEGSHFATDADAKFHVYAMAAAGDRLCAYAVKVVDFRNTQLEAMENFGGENT